jgi:hypothetical protein
MPILSKNLPPPPAPIELTPQQIETKRRLDAEEAEKQAVARRLDEARKRLGKLSPQLIEDVRLLANDAIDRVVSIDLGCGIPFEMLRRDAVGRAGSCACSGFMLVKDCVK